MSKQIYWEDVFVGSELPSYSLEVTPTLIVDHVSGSQDYNLYHHDEEFVHSKGIPNIFVNTRFTAAALCRLVTDWMGDQGWLKLFSYQMRRMNCPGDVMTIKGKVAGRYIDNDKHCVECEIWIENQREGITTPGKAVVVLPSRGN